jgi:DNA-binding transcriptional ArsR family regulator
MLKRRLDNLPISPILKSVLDYDPLDLSLRALADPTRRALIERLSRGPASVSELAQPFNLTLAAIAQHVGVLEKSGLIRSVKVGRVRTCQIEPRGLAPLADWVSARRSLVERQLDRLGDVLAEHSRPAHGPDQQEGAPR